MSGATAQTPRTALLRALKPGLLVGGLLAAGFGLRVILGGHASDILQDMVADGGASSVVLFMGLSTLLVAIGLPRQIPAFVGAYAFGLWTGFALAMLVQCVACAADFIWARVLARDFVARRFGGRLRRLDARLARQPFRATLVLRLMPVGSNILLNLLAGVSSVGFLAFLAGSAVGYVPQTIVFALLGSGVQVSHSYILMIGIATFAASTGLGIALLRTRSVQ